MPEENGPVLVTGATGRQGGSVARHLLHAGHLVRTLTRSPHGPASDRLREAGAEVVGGDLNDGSSLHHALRGVRAVARTGRREAMYTVYTTDANGRLRGVLSLRELLAAPEGGRLADQAWTEIVTVLPTAPQEDVARMAAEWQGRLA